MDPANHSAVRPSACFGEKTHTEGAIVRGKTYRGREILGFIQERGMGVEEKRSVKKKKKDRSGLGDEKSAAKGKPVRVLSSG